MQQAMVEGYRLSPQQRHLWLQKQTDSSRAFLSQCLIVAEGKLEKSILQRAVEKTIARHEILGTTFHLAAGMKFPVQVIKGVRPSWTERQKTDSTEAPDIELNVQSLFKESEQLNYDFEQGPLFHISISELSPDKHLLLISLSALCTDGVGLKNLVKDIALSYQSTLTGNDIDNDPIQYADVSEWLNDLQEGEETEAGREYWRRQDLSAISAMALPLENAIHENAIFKSDVVSLKIDAGQIKQLRQIATTNGSTLSAAILSCWQILLWRLIGQAEIVIGVSHDGRSYEGLDEAIGLFAKYLPLRSHLGTDLSFTELLRKTRDSVSEIHEWQEYFNWDSIVNQTVASSQRHFAFCYEYEAAPEVYHAGDIKFSILGLEACVDRYKVRLSCVEEGNSLTVNFHFDANLFAQSDIERLAAQFHKLLESVVVHHEVPITELEILGEAERRYILFDLNNTRTDYISDTTFHALFEQQAELAPSAAAVICDDQQLNYSELNERANRLAGYLRTLGAKEGTFVGICLERSVDIAVASLAVFKTGAALVPLDPTYPTDRLAFMLKDANVPLLVTEQSLIDKLPENNARTVAMDVQWEEISKQNPSLTNFDLSPSSLAYVIYTSGSTGEPRGVMITHGNLCQYVQAMKSSLDIKSGDRFLHMASISFSSSIRQLAVPLANGATVVIATAEQRLDPIALFNMVKQHGVTIIDLVPSHWRSCLQAIRQLDSQSRASLLDNDVRLALSASEALTSDVPHSWTSEFKCKADFTNMFGQTETAGIVAVYPIHQHKTGRAKIVPAGRPIANTQIYLLNDHMEPLPMGATGELYIGGDDVGCGYLNRPEMTAERFVPDPFSDKPGARLYKTGDIARYMSDGNIEFLGRNDQQVKIRGFRVELGEIEAVLNSHQAIQESFVITQGEKGLLAFVVPKQSPAPSKDGLQSFLRERLPAYMIPSSITILDALPITPNGKLDRRALMNYQEESLDHEAAFVAPRTPVEEMLAEIWLRLLSISRVGIHDNFFRIGGHSLLATVLVSRVREAFQIELPVVALFESPTIAELADTIEKKVISQVDTKQLFEMMTEMDSLSDEEIQALLSSESPKVN